MPSDVYDEFTNGGTLKASRAVFKTVLLLIRFVAPAGIIAVFISLLI